MKTISTLPESVPLRHCATHAISGGDALAPPVSVPLRHCATGAILGDDAPAPPESVPLRHCATDAISGPDEIGTGAAPSLKVSECQSATRYIREGESRYADPQAFGHLLNLIADRGISIWFDSSGMHWKADEDAVDAELLRLLRRFRNALQQAYGPDLLPADEPVRRSGGIRRKELPPSSGSQPVPDGDRIDPDRGPLPPLESEQSSRFRRYRPPHPLECALYLTRLPRRADRSSE